MRHDEFERLYEEHAAGLFSFLAYRTRNRVQAEDLLADTFERVLKARRRFDPRKGSEKAWLYSIALNLLRDQVRRQGAEERALERAPAPATAPTGITGGGFEGVEDRERLMTALEVLTPEERDTVTLRFGGDLTLPQIAKVTGERLSTVEGRFYRALKKLRQALGD